MREKYSGIEHEYDLWHIVKGINKKMLSSGEKDLIRWTHAVATHMWYCVSTCNDDVTLLKEKWISILHHSTNVHRWTTADVFFKCDHARYSREEARKRLWLQKNTKAHNLLQQIVTDKRLLKALNQVS